MRANRRASTEGGHRLAVLVVTMLSAANAPVDHLAQVLTEGDSAGSVITAYLVSIDTIIMTMYSTAVNGREPRVTHLDCARVYLFHAAASRPASQSESSPKPRPMCLVPLCCLWLE